MNLQRHSIILPVQKNTMSACASWLKREAKKLVNTGLKTDEDGSLLTFHSEEEFYAHFDLPFIPPELREDGSEVDNYTEGYGLYI